MNTTHTTATIDVAAQHGPTRRARRTFTSLALVAVLPFALASCASGGDAPIATGTTPGETPTETANPNITVGNLGDPFCALSIESEGTSDALDSLGDASTIFTSTDIATVNAWGQELLEGSEQILDYYARGAQYIDDAATLEAWNTMSSFISAYTLSLGHAAADSSSVAEAQQAMLTVMQNPEILAVVETAPTAAQLIIDYTTERCTITN